MEPQQPSNGERTTERMKRSQLRPGQFRLATLITAISLLAVVLGAVSLSGVGYRWFFHAGLVVISAFLPFLAWFAASYLSIRRRIHRYSLTLAVTALGGIALLVGAAIQIPLRDIFVGAIVVAVFWPLLAIWAHSIDVELFGGTKDRDPNSFWSRFTLALARMQERGGESVFRCCRCQRIRTDSGRLRRQDGWLCHECYLSEVRHSENPIGPEHGSPSLDESETESTRGSNP
ncbi:MAG: hypothetical protein ISR77_39610 [Pirellulaceae bacterium]|nr:hypothetical protein [Pirellulaceae bacterium]